MRRILALGRAVGQRGGDRRCRRERRDGRV